MYCDLSEANQMASFFKVIRHDIMQVKYPCGCFMFCIDCSFYI